MRGMMRRREEITMKLVTYNIQYGLGKDNCYNLPRIAKAVEKADIIALQEVECYWQRSGMVDQVAELAALLPEFHWVYGPGVDLDASYRADNGHPVHRRRQFGNMLLARPPILSSRNHLLPKYGTRNGVSLQRSALETVVETAAGALRCYSLHLTHLAAKIRRQEIEALVDIHRRASLAGGVLCGGHHNPDSNWFQNGNLPPMPRAAVLMGDFNLTPIEAEYELITGPASPRYGRLGSTDGFFDAWTLAGHMESEGISCPGHGRIDYCFVSTELAEHVRTVYIDSEAQGSDHQPVWIEVDW